MSFVDTDTYSSSFIGRRNSAYDDFISQPVVVSKQKEMKSTKFAGLKASVNQEIKRIESTFENIFKYLLIGGIVTAFLFLIIFIAGWYYIWNNTSKNTVLKNSFVSTAVILYLVQILGGILSIAVMIVLFIALFNHKIHIIKDNQNAVVGIKFALVAFYFALFLLFLFNSIFFGNARYYDSRSTDATTMDTTETKSETTTPNTTKTVTVITITTLTTTRPSTGNVIATGTVLHYILNIGATVLSGIGFAIFIGSIAVNKDLLD